MGSDATAMADQIRAVLRTELRDQNVLEIETTQAIVSRVSEWAKLFAFFTAIPVAFLLGGLAIWGVTKFTDVNEKLKDAKVRAESLRDTSAQLEQKYATLQQDAERYRTLGRDIEAVAERSVALGRELQSVKSDVSEIGKHIGFMPSSALTPDLQKRLEKSLVSFEKYLGELGYKPGGRPLQVSVVDTIAGSPDTVASYSPGSRRMTITKKHATEDPANILEEYMEDALQEQNGSWSSAPTYYATRLALCKYFPASFLGSTKPGDSARWPETIGSTEDEIDHSVNVGADALAQVLWDMRGRFPPRSLDHALFFAWTSTQGSYQRPDYEASLLREALGQLGKKEIDVQDILTRHGLHLK